MQEKEEKYKLLSKNYTKTNSFSIIRESRGQGNFIFSVLKEKNCQPKILYPKYPSRMKVK